ncbi:hypothetical protein C4E44_28685 [Pseudomonas sp. MWU12-2312b]|nr:hypothetical protein C4E44_28685 [Pseudomonas sp. MWU12-2312b]
MIPVGASLLAMVVNDDAENLSPRGALRFFANRLAPTGNRVYFAMIDVNNGDSINRCNQACNRR